MRSLPLPASIYILFLFGVAVLLASISLILLIDSPLLVLYVLLLSVLIAVLDLFPVHLSPGETEFTISTAVEVAAVLLFSAPVVILAVFLGNVLAELRVKRVYYKKLFNIGAMTINYAILFWVYQWVHAPSTGLVESFQDVFALLVLAISNLLLNSLLLSIAISLASRSSLIYVWSENIKPMIWIDLSQVPLGAFIALLWRVSPWAVIFVAIPLFLLRHAYQLINDLRRQTLDALLALARILAERDHSTQRHSELVAKNSEGIARVLGLSQAEIDIIVRAAYLHDIGKIGMANDILFKPGPLSSDERDMATQHAVIGSELLKKFPAFDVGALYVRHHHERWDGTGYPDGLRGTQIPLGARIITVADAFQAMTEDRPYRRALSSEVALQEIYKNAGLQFDPEVMRALFQVIGCPLPSEDLVPERVLSESQVS